MGAIRYLGRAALARDGRTTDGSHAMGRPAPSLRHRWNLQGKLSHAHDLHRGAAQHRACVLPDHSGLGPQLLESPGGAGGLLHHSEPCSLTRAVL